MTKNSKYTELCQLEFVAFETDFSFSSFTVLIQGVFFRGFYGERKDEWEAVRPEVSEEKAPLSHQSGK